MLAGTPLPIRRPCLPDFLTPSLRVAARYQIDHLPVGHVRQMLTHTSGFPDVKDYGWDRPQYDDGALERYIRDSAGVYDFNPDWLNAL